MALEQIPTNVPSEEISKDVKDASSMEKIQDSNNQSQEIVELNKNQKLAKEEADKIVEWLPKTIDQLSSEQQQEFIQIVEWNIYGLGLNFAPKSPEKVPEKIPNDWKQQIENYKTIRENISQLPPDKQEAIRMAEKEAIFQMTEEASEVIDADK